MSWQVGAPVGGAAIATLRANLHELAAEFHELAASVHDWSAEEHAHRLRYSSGDTSFLQVWHDLRRTAAAAERANALKERHAADYWRRHSEAETNLSNEDGADVAGPRQTD